MTPNDRKYTSTHEWIKMEEDLAVVGITSHAQQQLGDITFVELPDIGQAVSAGDDVAEIESVKAAGDVYAPVDGEIADVNEALEDEPEQVNLSPYEEGWIYKLKNVKAADLEALLDAKAYQVVLEKEESDA